MRFPTARTGVKLLALSVAALLALAALGGCGSKESNDQPAAEPVVKKVDHVTVSCTDPEGPLQHPHPDPGAAGGLALQHLPRLLHRGRADGQRQRGDLKFEGEAPGQQMPPFTFVYGIVFEPYPLDQVTGELEARGADPGQPRDQMREVNGQQVKMWTDVTLQALCTQAYIVYLVDYTDQAKAALTANTVTGSPLGGIGLTGVKEIDILSTQPDQTRQLWETVFAPAPMSADGVQAYGSGPGRPHLPGKPGLHRGPGAPGGLAPDGAGLPDRRRHAGRRHRHRTDHQPRRGAGPGHPPGGEVGALGREEKQVGLRKLVFDHFRFPVSPVGLARRYRRGLKRLGGTWPADVIGESIMSRNTFSCIPVGENVEVPAGAAAPAVHRGELHRAGFAALHRRPLLLPQLLGLHPARPRHRLPLPGRGHPPAGPGPGPGSQRGGGPRAPAARGGLTAWCPASGRPGWTRGPSG